MRKTQKLNVPILTYHSIDDSGSIISTGLDVFQRQMKSLSASGYNAVSMADLAAALTGGETILPRTVALTFDDGFQNFFTSALPVLKQHGFNATVFLVSGRCGEFNDWQGNPVGLPRSRMLTWNEVKELSENGVEVGSHTMTHPDLTKIDIEAARNEIMDSKAAIEDALGRAVTTFAYPFGRYNAEVKDIMKHTFTAACSTNLGKVSRDSDIFSLNRIDCYYLRNQKLFDSVSTSGFDHYLWVRQSMRKFKSLFN